MLQNPIVQTVLLFFGAYSILTILHRREPFGAILVLLAAIVVVVLWMLRYNRPALHGAYQNPVFKPFIDLVCSMVKEQPPVDAVDDAVASPMAAAPAAADSTPARPRAPVSARSYSAGSAGAPASTAAAQPAGTAAQQTPLLLLADGDFKMAVYQLKQRLVGMDAQIEQTIQQMQRNLKMREKGSSAVYLPPVGMFLFLGKQGLGKRSLAVEIGRRLYSGKSVAVLDLAEAGASMEQLLAAAKANPHQTFVIENVDQASRRAQDDLLAIVAGQPLVDSQSGARISFRNACIFLLIHKDASSMPNIVTSGGAGGFTVAAERVAGETSLDSLLAQGLHGVIPFQLPEKTLQAEAVAMIMEAECKKYDLSLGSVSPAILAREVQEVSALGSFRGVPVRVSRILSRAIHEAIESQQTVVNVN